MCPSYLKKGAIQVSDTLVHLNQERLHTVTGSSVTTNYPKHVYRRTGVEGSKGLVTTDLRKQVFTHLETENVS